MTGPTTVDEYFAALPPDRLAVMDDLRRTINGAAPGAVEAIAYDMPALRLDGRFLVSYAAYKRHYSVFAWNDEMIRELGPELQRYATGKGTISFPANRPVPLDLVRRIVEFRLAEHGRRGGDPG
jgi:uncharacterized protein YdhG (YjbR/CyaY superfamily)